MGIVIAILGIVVLVVAIFALRHPRANSNAADAGRTSVDKSLTTAPGSSSSSTKNPSSSGSTTPSKPAGVKAVPLVVLNNTDVGGLADRTAKKFRAAGWTVTKTDNLPATITDVISSCAYYDPTSAGAKAAAEALQKDFPGVARVAPRFKDLPAGPVVVVLNPDFPTG